MVGSEYLPAEILDPQWLTAVLPQRLLWTTCWTTSWLKSVVGWPGGHIDAALAVVERQAAAGALP